MVLQRIQTVYLFLAAVLTAVFGYLICCPQGWGIVEIIDVILSVLVVVLSLIAIFCYLTLRLQSALCTICALLSLSLVVCYCLGAYPEWCGVWKVAFPAIATILFILAKRGIKHDIKLLSDSSRLR